MQKLLKYPVLFLLIVSLFIVSSSGLLEARPRVEDYISSPPFVSGTTPPLVLLVMARDQRLYNQAYNDSSDLDGDGALDIGFNPGFLYYGLFNPFFCYKPPTVGKPKEFFTITGRATTETTSYVNPMQPEQKSTISVAGICPGLGIWSGNYLNYLTTFRIDALKKALYGGERVIDEPGKTVVKAVSLHANDAHGWGKEVYSDKYWPKYMPYYNSANFTAFAKPDNVGEFNHYMPYPISAEVTFKEGSKHFFIVYYQDSYVYQVPMIEARLNQMTVKEPSYGNCFVLPMDEREFCITDEEPSILYWIYNEAPLPNNFTTSNPSSNPFLFYSLRVEVCNSNYLPVGKEIEFETCKEYPNGTVKPIGILQRYGESEQMFFGLMTGSFDHNLQGGVLRRNISSIKDEIEQDTGIFKTNFKGIINTIDAFRIVGWDYNISPANYPELGLSNCGFRARYSLKDGQCIDWGNPIGEMIYEAIRYFNSETGPTSSFLASNSVAEQLLGIGVENWKNPFDNVGFNDPTNLDPSGTDCLKPYIMIISDVDVTYDSDNVPGSAFGSGISDSTSYDLAAGIKPGALDKTINATKLLNRIGEHEGYGDKHYYVGESASTIDGSCAAKYIPAGQFAKVRGLCPTSPNKEGSYNSAAMAYFAHTHKLNKGKSEPAMIYSVALASNMPVISFPFSGKQKIDILPLGKTVGGVRKVADGPSSILEPFLGRHDYQPTNVPLQLFIRDWKTYPETLTGAEHYKNKPYYAVYDVNYEFLEQGGNFDMDAIVRYTISVVVKNCSGSDCDDRKVTDIHDLIGLKADKTYYQAKDANDALNNGVGLWIYTLSRYGASYGQQYLGYIISGTKYDGSYLVVRDLDTLAADTKPYYMTTPDTCSQPDGPTGAPEFCGAALVSTLKSERVFAPSPSAKEGLVLPDPLWLAAKYGGFKLNNEQALPVDKGMNIPGGTGVYTESNWATVDGKNPDNYFLVTNPLMLKSQIEKVFSAILENVSTGSAMTVTNKTSIGGGSVYNTMFYPNKESSGGVQASWIGYLQSFFIDDWGRYREDSRQNKHLDLYGGSQDYVDTIITFRKGSDGPEIVHSFDLDNSGNETIINVSNDFTKLKTIWEAGELLAKGKTAISNRSYTDVNANPTEISDRHLLTYIGDFTGPRNTLIPFSSSSASKLVSYLRAPAVYVYGTGSNKFLISSVAEGKSGTRVQVTFKKDDSLLVPATIGTTTTNNSVTVTVTFRSDATASQVAATVNSVTVPYIYIDLPDGDVGTWKLTDTFSKKKLDEDYGAKMLIDYSIGNDNDFWRSRKLLDSSSNKITWRLGDIINSRPEVVGVPGSQYDVRYKDRSFAKFRKNNVERRNVVYVGSNDGILHAFNAGFPRIDASNVYGYNVAKSNGTGANWNLGMEIWGYIPQAMLPHLRWLPDKNYGHIYGVDLQPRAVDYKDALGNWKTALIGGFRLGANTIDIGESTHSGDSAPPVYNVYTEIFALDISDPESPPTMLWNFSDEKLGLTTSRPALVRTESNWYVIFGSGPNGDGGLAYQGISKQNAFIYVLNMHDGSLAVRKEVEQPNSFLTSPLILADLKSKKDTSSSDKATTWTNPAVYFGATTQENKGALIQVNPTATSAPSEWSVKTIIEGTTDEHLGAISALPNVALNCSRELWTFLGTGRFWTVSDGTACFAYCKINPNAQECIDCKKIQQNMFLGLKRKGVTDSDVSTLASLTDVSKVKVSKTGVDDGGNSTLSEDAYRSKRNRSNEKGYKVKLIDENEIVNTQPKIISLNNCGCLVAFTTYIPPSGVCDLTGSGYLYVLDCYLGVSTSQTAEFMGSDGSGEYNKRIHLGSGIPTEIVVINTPNGIFLQAGDGEMNLQRFKIDQGLKSGLKAWREEQRGEDEKLR